MALIEEHLDTPPNTGSAQMMVRKRNGDLEPVNLDKIVKAVERSSEGLSGVDPLRIATRTSGVVLGLSLPEYWYESASCTRTQPELVAVTFNFCAALNGRAPVVYGL